MKEKILDIIQNNYNKFRGANEAELQSAEEIDSLFNTHFLTFSKWKDENYVMAGFGVYFHNDVYTKYDATQTFINAHAKTIEQLIQEWKTINNIK